MESAELTKLVFSRVQKVDPDNVCKIVGCILLREPDEDSMVQLAYGPDATLVATVVDAKATLAAIYARCSSSSAAHHQQQHHYQQHHLCSPHPGQLRHFSPGAAFSFQYWAAADSGSPAAAEKDHYAFVDAAAAAESPYGGDHLDGGGGGGYCSYAATSPGAGGPRRRSNNGRRPCHYFFKGICKNGQNCHYSHHQVYADMDHQHHLQGNGGGTTPGSLERLEVEITELLHSRRGQPVSIASLPTLYGEMYGKGLQADGYLTESQRHGKAGYSLTKLLSRLNKIRVIERY